MTRTTGTIDGKELIALHDQMRQARMPFESLWSDIADYVMPRRDPPGGTIGPSTQKEARLFDVTAVHANMVLANGCVAWMSPMEGAWFAFTAGEGLGENDEAVRFLTRATEITRGKLARSNFYTAVHEFYLDRSAFGTAALYVEPGANALPNVQHWPTGTFVVDEDAEGNVDTVVRKFHLTTRQAATKFGTDAVSERIRKSAEDPRKSTEKHAFYHFVMPRTPAEQATGAKRHGTASGEAMPVASIYVEAVDGHVCRVGGYEEMPVFVSRYLAWGSGFSGPYGWAPSFAALPEARQVNFLQKMMDALAEKMAFPPVLVPDGLEGEIDPNSRGVTYFDPSLANALPREWMQGGRYDVGKDRVLERQAAINRAFHVDLFQMFGQLDKQMTAREVAERSSEKLIQFSPTFARLVTELFNPLLQRLYAIGLRGQWFGEIPQSMVAQRGEQLWVPDPGIEYTSRIAQALRTLPVLAMHRMFELLAPMLQTNPDVTDNLDFDAMLRLAANVESLPADMLRPVAAVKRLRAVRAQAQQAAAQQQQAALAANTAAQVGRIPADSAIGQMVAQQLPGSVA